MKKEWEKLSREEVLAEAQADREFHLIPDGEGTYIGIWPELPGCASCGATMQEALEQGLLAKKAWFKAILLKAVSAEDLQHVPEYETDNREAIAAQMPVLPPSAEEMAIKDTLINEGDSIILVEDTEENLSELVEELNEAGFGYEDIHPELPATGVLVNLYFEVYAFARSGVRIAEPFRRKGICCEDFAHVDEIYSRIGSLTEGISEVDQAELDRIYADSKDDMTFGELLEQFREQEKETSLRTRQMQAGPAWFTVPGNWVCEEEKDGSGFFCTDEDEQGEFSAYYIEVDLSGYTGEDAVFATLQQHYLQEEKEMMLVNSEKIAVQERNGIRFLFTSADHEEISRIVILDGRTGLLQIEYCIPITRFAYLSDPMEKVLGSVRFGEEGTND